MFKKGYDSRFQTAQTIPVFISEMVFRLFYSIRRLIKYYTSTQKEIRSGKLLWKNCELCSNATVKRMMTVAHGTFCLIDIGDASIFDEVVFDDSVQEFLNLKTKLSNYFDPSCKEDIFDYIPLQQTNQIFTPKKVVKEMVDLLEEENPGCFDDDSKTFSDLYMKSGMYIAEIVKRLYNSEKMREL